MKSFEEKRTNSFLWDSRQELYDYFSATYNLAKTDIDSEIDSCMKIFRFRQGQPVNTKELWQKVGMSLERKMAKAKSAAPVSAHK